MEITTASTADTDIVVELWVSLASDQQQHGSDLLADENRMAIRESLVQRIVTDDVLLARDEGMIVGFVMLTIEHGRYARSTTHGLIENIFVRPEFRRRGMGSELLRAAEEALTDAGAETIGLEVMFDNEAARRFYRSHGYTANRIELTKPTENDTL